MVTVDDRDPYDMADSKCHKYGCDTKGVYGRFIRITQIGMNRLKVKKGEWPDHCLLLSEVEFFGKVRL